jgi:hypothetical protein
MATSTNIQYLEGSAKDEFGATVQIGAGTSDRRQIETFLAGAAITAGDWVMFDTSATGASRVLTVIQATAVALGNPLTVGVALTSATVAGQKVDVVVGGYVEVCNVDGAVVAGSPLTVDTTAGRAHVAATGDIVTCGVALAADVANVAPVWVFKQF